MAFPVCHALWFWVRLKKPFVQDKKIDLAQVVLVSDAFFPFPDSIDLIAAAGIQWIAQPAGSARDASVFEAAEKSNINMVVTNTRHFKH